MPVFLLQNWRPLRTDISFFGPPWRDLNSIISSSWLFIKIKVENIKARVINVFILIFINNQLLEIIEFK
jgi:hypothetical protein